MKKVLLLSCCVQFFGFSSTATAVPVVPSTMISIARDYLLQRVTVQRVSTASGSPGATIAVSDVTPLHGGAAVRFKQVIHGVDVLNTQAVVVVINGRAIDMRGQLPPIHTAASGARQLTRDQLISILHTWDPHIVIQRAHLGWLVDSNATARLVWQADIQRLRPFDILRVRIDAATGTFLSGLSRIVHASGNTYTFNPVANPAVQTVELLGLTDPQKLTGPYADAQSCQHNQQTMVCSRYAVADANGNYIFQPTEPSVKDPFAEVNAYYHTDAFHRWLAQQFGFSRKLNGGNQQIKVVVNFSFETTEGETQGIYNAFFGDMDNDGHGEIVFGQGQRDFAYDADVITHEFTHSVIEETANFSLDVDHLGINLMPGALNESFSDLISCIYAGDGQVGEYAGNGSIRDLEGNALTCADHMTGESHTDGLIWGRTIWAIRNQFADQKIFNDVLYKTMVSLNKSASFIDAAQLFVKLAQESSADLATVAHNEFTQRGIYQCDRIIALTEAQPRQGLIMGKSGIPISAMPGSMQYKIEVPTSAVAMNLSIRRIKAGNRPSRFGAYIRKGQPVAYDGSKATYDYQMTSAQSSLLLSADDTAFSLEVGQTYYVSPNNESNRSAYYEISVAFEEARTVLDGLKFSVLDRPKSPVAPTITTDKDQGEVTSASGCSMTASHRPSTEWLSSLSVFGLGLGLVALRRRRRASL